MHPKGLDDQKKVNMQFIMQEIQKPFGYFIS
jgi:hypothetical protein